MAKKNRQDSNSLLRGLCFLRILYESFRFSFPLFRPFPFPFRSSLLRFSRP